MSQVNRRVALVTGGARGFGYAIAEALVQAGVAVAIVDQRDASDQAETLSKSGIECRAFQCDLGDSAAIHPLLDSVDRWAGAVDVFVHNAALFPTTPVDTLTLAQWRQVFAVNLEAAMLISQRLAADMRKSRWGRIVFIASGTIGMGRRDVSAYISSKMGLVGLARGLASELGAHGITANVVAPGFAETEGTLEKFDRFDDLASSIVKRQTIPRLVTREEIAASVSFLCSDDAAMITGQTWMVDGGWVRL